MGYTIIPLCKKCGYKTKSIAVGSGRLNHLTHYSIPVLNTETNEIEGINLYDYKKNVVVKQKFLYFFSRKVITEKINNKYIPYYDSKLFIDDKSLDNRYYNKSNNLCPKCKSFNLEFIDEGIYFD